MLIGPDGLAKLRAAKVAVFGVGGVGGYAVEALARAGVGAIGLYDGDVFCLSNLNRQLHATHSTIGRYKVDAAKERIALIDPEITVEAHRVYYRPDNADTVDISKYDYILDAVDMVTAKLELAVRAHKAGIPIIACMGAGNKLNPAAFEVGDIYGTEVCKLSKVMRTELRKKGVPALKVVWSREPALIPLNLDPSPTRRVIPGSISFAPAAAGIIMAGEAVRDYLNIKYKL